MAKPVKKLERVQKPIRPKVYLVREAFVATYADGRPIYQDYILGVFDTIAKADAYREEYIQTKRNDMYERVPNTEWHDHTLWGHQCTVTLKHKLYDTLSYFEIHEYEVK